MRDVKINMTKSDKLHLDNLVRLLGRAKFDGLEASELLLAADSLRWLVGLQQTVVKGANAPDMAVSPTPPIKEAPKLRKKKA